MFGREMGRRQGESAGMCIESGMIVYWRVAFCVANNCGFVGFTGCTRLVVTV